MFNSINNIVNSTLSFKMFRILTTVFLLLAHVGLSNADTIDDLSNASLNAQNIGTWQVVAEVSAAPLLMLTLLASYVIFRKKIPLL